MESEAEEDEVDEEDGFVREAADTTLAVTRLPRIHSQIRAITSIADMREKTTEARMSHEEDILNPQKKRLLELYEWYSYIREMGESAKEDPPTPDKEDNVESQDGTGRKPLYAGGFPTSENPSFQGDITKKAEFWAYREDSIVAGILDRLNEKDTATRTSSQKKFRLQSHQRFIPRFLSKDTPYNEILLYHGVGTGKTCTAVQIAEMYLQETGGERRPIIIAPVSVQGGFKNEIFSATPRSGVLSQQCTGDSYLTAVSYTPEMRLQSALRRIQSLIRIRYDFHGYRGFELFFERAILKKAKKAYPEDIAAQSKEIINGIERVFGDRLLIIDEVHNIRDPANHKKIRHYLDLIARYAPDTKMIPMTATPMYNTDDEIITILNILRVNRGLPPIPRELVFDDKAGLIEPMGERLLAIAANGFVSYLRGENPIDFPARIDPYERILEGRPPRPTRTEKGEEIDPHPFPDHRDILPIVRVPLREGTVIGDAYMEKMRYLGEGERKLIAAGTSISLVQQGVVTFPGGESGKDAFRDTFDEVKDERKRKRGLFTAKKGEGIVDGGAFFLDADRSEAYAPKIKEATAMALRAKGIVLIFTENIYGSAIPVAMALERQGATRYGEAPLLQSSKDMNPPVPPTGVKYTLLTAEPSLTKNLEKTLRILNAKDNINGEKIKIVIATRAVSEGVNFQNIREVHMMDSYYHMSLIDQVVGRAIRFRSHDSLPRKERNVTVYTWCVSWGEDHPRYGTETLDEEMYRLAETKSVRIGRVSRVLKQVAVDCHMMLPKNDRSGEHYTGTLTIEDAQGNTRGHTFQDTAGSRECDYETDCAIRCAVPLTDEEKGRSLATQFLAGGSGSETEIQAVVRDVMTRKKITTLPDLLMTVRSEIPGTRTSLIRNTLATMIRTGTRILLPDGGVATLEYRKKGSGEIIALGPSEVSDSYATYAQRISRIPRKAIGYWGSSYTKSKPAASAASAGEADADSKEPEEEDDGGGDDYEAVYQSFLEDFSIAWGRASGADGAADTRTLRTITLRYNTYMKEDTSRIQKLLAGAKLKKIPKHTAKEDYLVYARRLAAFAEDKGVDVGFIETAPYRVGYIGKSVGLLREHIRGIKDSMWAGIVAENIETEDTTKDIRYPYMAESNYRREILLRIARSASGAASGDAPLPGPFTRTEVEAILFETYRETKEIVPAGIRFADGELHVITMNSSGNIDTLKAPDGTIVREGMKPSKVTLRPGLHSYRAQPTSQSNVPPDMPRGIILYFVQDFMEATFGKTTTKTMAKGIMCRGNTHPNRFKSIAGYLSAYLESVRSDIVLSEEFKKSILPKDRGGNGVEILRRNHFMSCATMEALTRHMKTYRPPYNSGSVRPK